MVGIMLLSAALALTGQDAPPPAKPAAQDTITVEGQQKARNKRVCKRSVATGSIMGKVTCKTAGEWEIERERLLADAEQARMRGLMADENRRINRDERPPAPR